MDDLGFSMEHRPARQGLMVQPGFYPLPSAGTVPEDIVTSETLSRGYQDATARQFSIPDTLEAELSLLPHSGSWDARALRKRVFGLLSHAQHQQQKRQAAAGGQGTGAQDADAVLGTPQPLRNSTCSEDEILAWLNQLSSSSHPRALLRSFPAFSSKDQLLRGLWQAQVPCRHAVWVVRHMYLKWVRAGMTYTSPSAPPPQQPQPQGTSRGLPHTSSQQQLSAMAGSNTNPAVTTSSTSSLPCWDLRPASLFQCSQLWTSHILGQLDSLLPAALSALGLAPPVPAGTQGSFQQQGGSSWASAYNMNSPALSPPISGTPDTPYAGTPYLNSAAMSPLNWAEEPTIDRPGRWACGMGPLGTSYQNAAALAQAAAAAAAHQLLHPGRAVQLQYFARLAGYSFQEGLVDAGQLLDWAAGLLLPPTSTVLSSVGSGGPGSMPTSSAQDVSGGPGASDYRASIALPLLAICVQELSSSQTTATKLVATLLEYLSTTRSRALQPQQTQAAPNNSTAAASHQVLPVPYSLRGQAVQMLEYMATACPSTLVALDALPILAAEVALHAWLQPLATSQATSGATALDSTPSTANVQLPTAPRPGLDAVFGSPASCLTFFHHVHASLTSHAEASSMIYSAGMAPGMAAVADLISRASALESEVSLRELTFDAGAAMQQLEAAMAAGDLDAGFAQLAACMGRQGYRAVDLAVQLVCDFAVALPCYVPTSFTSPATSSEQQGGGVPSSTAPTQQQQQQQGCTPLESDPGPRLLFAVNLLTLLHDHLAEWVTKHALQAAPEQVVSAILKQGSSGKGSSGRDRLGSGAKGGAEAGGTAAHKALGGKSSKGHKRSASGSADIAAAGTTKAEPPAAGGQTAAGKHSSNSRQAANDLGAAGPSYLTLVQAAHGHGLLQEALVHWVEEHEVASGAGEEAAVAARHEARTATLLLMLERVGLFSPQLLASRLVGQGIFSLTAMGSEHGLARAARLHTYLQHLHPAALAASSTTLSANSSYSHTLASQHSVTANHQAYAQMRRRLLHQFRHSRLALQHPQRSPSPQPAIVQPDHGGADSALEEGELDDAMEADMVAGAQLHGDNEGVHSGQDRAPKRQRTGQGHTAAQDLQLRQQQNQQGDGRLVHGQGQGQPSSGAGYTSGASHTLAPGHTPWSTSGHTSTLQLKTLLHILLGTDAPSGLPAAAAQPAGDALKGDAGRPAGAGSRLLAPSKAESAPAFAAPAGQHAPRMAAAGKGTTSANPAGQQQAGRAAYSQLGTASTPDPEDAIALARNMHPWQQRVLATAVCAEVERTFALHGLPPPPLAAWPRTIQASTSASAAQAAAASALALGLLDQATLDGLVSGDLSRGSQPTGLQGSAATAGAIGAYPAQHDPLQVPTPEQYEGHPPLGRAVPGSTGTVTGQGSTRAVPGDGIPDTALDHGTPSGNVQPLNPASVAGRQPGEIAPRSQPGWLWRGVAHGDAWLLRVVSLLEACCAWPEVLSLLTHLLATHIQHSVSATALQQPSLAQPGQPGGEAQQGVSAAAVLGIQESTVVGLVVCVSDRLSTSGLLPQLLSTCCAWAMGPEALEKVHISNFLGQRLGAWHHPTLSDLIASSTSNTRQKGVAQTLSGAGQAAAGASVSDMLPPAAAQADTDVNDTVTVTAAAAAALPPAQLQSLRLGPLARVLQLAVHLLACHMGSTALASALSAVQGTTGGPQQGGTPGGAGAPVPAPAVGGGGSGGAAGGGPESGGSKGGNSSGGNGGSGPCSQWWSSLCEVLPQPHWLTDELTAALTSVSAFASASARAAESGLAFGGAQQGTGAAPTPAASAPGGFQRVQSTPGLLHGILNANVRTTVARTAERLLVQLGWAPAPRTSASGGSTDSLSSGGRGTGVSTAEGATKGLVRARPSTQLANLHDKISSALSSLSGPGASTAQGSNPASTETAAAAAVSSAARQQKVSSVGIQVASVAAEWCVQVAATASLDIALVHAVTALLLAVCDARCQAYSATTTTGRGGLQDTNLSSLLSGAGCDVVEVLCLLQKTVPVLRQQYSSTTPAPGSSTTTALPPGQPLPPPVAIPPLKFAQHIMSGATALLLACATDPLSGPGGLAAGSSTGSSGTGGTALPAPMAVLAPGTASLQPHQWAGCLLAMLGQCAVRGLVPLPDLITTLQAAVPPTRPQLYRFVQLYLLGPGAVQSPPAALPWASDWVPVQRHASRDKASPARTSPSGPAAPVQILPDLKVPVPNCHLLHMGPGEASLLCMLQARLPADLVLSSTLETLLSVGCCQSPGNTGSNTRQPGVGGAGGGGVPAATPLVTLAEISIATHAPLRLSLLRSPLHLHTRLVSKRSIAAAARLVRGGGTAGTAYPAPTLAQGSAAALAAFQLPQLRVLGVLLSGIASLGTADNPPLPSGRNSGGGSSGLAPSAQSGPRSRRSSPAPEGLAGGNEARGPSGSGAGGDSGTSTMEAQLREQCIALAYSLTPCNLELVRICARLLVDEQAVGAAARSDRQKSIADLMEAMLHPLPVSLGGSSGTAGAGGTTAGGQLPSSSASTQQGVADSALSGPATEKALCDAMVASIVDRPHVAALHGQLAWQVSPTMGQTLLRALSTLLEDAPPPLSTVTSGPGAAPGVTSSVGPASGPGAGAGAGRRAPAGNVQAAVSNAGAAGLLRPPRAFLLGHIPLSEVLERLSQGNVPKPHTLLSPSSSSTLVPPPINSTIAGYRITPHVLRPPPSAFAAESALAMLVVVTLYNVRLAMPQVATATFKQWAGDLVSQLGSICQALRQSVAAAAVEAKAGDAAQATGDNNSGGAGAAASAKPGTLARTHSGGMPAGATEPAGGATGGGVGGMRRNISSQALRHSTSSKDLRQQQDSMQVDAPAGRGAGGHSQSRSRTATPPPPPPPPVEGLPPPPPSTDDGVPMQIEPAGGSGDLTLPPPPPPPPPPLPGSGGPQQDTSLTGDGAGDGSSAAAGGGGAAGAGGRKRVFGARFGKGGALRMGAGAAQAGGATPAGQQAPGAGAATDATAAAGTGPAQQPPQAALNQGASEQQQLQQGAAAAGGGLRRNQSFGAGRAASLSSAAAVGAGADASTAATASASNRPAPESFGAQGGTEGGTAAPGGTSAVQQGSSGSTTLIGAVPGIQVALWTRLRAIQPLLPIVYADRDPSTRNLRTQLVSTLLQLLASPAVQHGATSVTAFGSPGVGTEQRLAGEAAQQQATVSAAAEAAVRSAGVPLFDRLLDVFTAMLSGTWAAWLRGGKKLKEVPPYDAIEALPQLLQEVDAELSRAAAAAFTGNTAIAAPNSGAPAGGIQSTPSGFTVPAPATAQTLSTELSTEKTPGSGVPPHIYATILSALHTLPVPLAVPLPLPGPLPPQLSAGVDAVEAAVKEFVDKMPPAQPAGTTAGAASTIGSTSGPPGLISTTRGPAGRDKLGLGSAAGAGASSGAAAAGLSTSGFGVGRGAPNSGAAATGAGGQPGGSTSSAAAGVPPGTPAAKGGTLEVAVLPAAGLPAWLPGICREAGAPAPGVLGGPIQPPSPALFTSYTFSGSSGAGVEQGAAGQEVVCAGEEGHPSSIMDRAVTLASHEGGDGEGAAGVTMTRAQLRRMLV